MRIFLYLSAIILANVLTAKFPPIALGALFFPVGSFLIGATFIFRDLVQNKYGRKRTYMFITLALVLSAIASYMLGDTLMIVFASAVSFIISEVCDTEIYTRMKSAFIKRVFISGVVGGTLDSVVFVVIGMSPLGAGFLPWELVPNAIMGQLLAKIGLQAIGALVLYQAIKIPKFKEAL
ncbi:VUT family protein [Pallidibacillus pasinlerensis]|uniref:VUT family protein n=1 Tax=Pallidibacillus pasinlerensis TaxID=2703818 RepID=A0ABX0A3U8_9BACI|nr:VUT family protein [Pallidibacillus pasinlerensis]NCU18056.1 VUT family protein [Pallidibacillus pasinlerensis]